jgi:hypothetical protein
MRGLVGYSHTTLSPDGAPSLNGNAIEIGLQTIQF